MARRTKRSATVAENVSAAALLALVGLAIAGGCGTSVPGVNAACTGDETTVQKDKDCFTQPETMPDLSSAGGAVGTGGSTTAGGASAKGGSGGAGGTSAKGGAAGANGGASGSGQAGSAIAGAGGVGGASAGAAGAGGEAAGAGGAAGAG